MASASESTVQRRIQRIEMCNIVKRFPVCWQMLLCALT